MKSTLLAAAFAAATATVSATTAFAAPVKYDLDASHSQIVFSYVHQGYSTTYGMFSGFEGEIMFDADAPAASTVSVSFPVDTMLTGWEARFKHFMSEDFFGASDDKDVSFKSTAINVTGEATAEITGDLTLNGMTKTVTLDAKLNQTGESRDGKPMLGFDAQTSILRSDYGLGKFVPYVGDEVSVMISLEAVAAE
ncbi:YceI family protein [Lentibacter algarum]|uniref:YceI family protein n=1 Tax=Lentibacter algarum TaxID=576131 RepID=UPI001C09CF08|nr:YceI family protein [Lentibacter algarum]MBU2982879.1 YceI family protein [Lentibacter algarum]